MIPDGAIGKLFSVAAVVTVVIFFAHLSTLQSS